MPSPFPGMDPYLENPDVWPDVHHRLIGTASDVLSDQLLPKYLVRTDLRVYVSDESDPGWDVIIPDLRVVRGAPGPGARRPKPRTTARPASTRTRGTGSLTVASPPEPIEATILIEEEVREHRLLIKRADTREVVTVIEILSPSNKAAGARGQANYTDKRAEVLSSGSHFVEIDLLRAGTRFWPRQRLPPHEYLVNVSRAERRPKATLWPVRLDQRLPVIPVPVLPGDPDALLDLQVILAEVYDRSGYAYDVDYKSDPVPPLPPKWRAWAKKLLAARSRRR